MDLKRGSLARTAGLGGPFLCGGRSGFAGRGPCCSSSRFSFDTIAWRKMESRLADHFRHQASTKRAAPTVSLNAVMDDAGMSLSDMLSATDESFLEMETGLLFHDLGRHMPRRDMNVLRLKADGYGTREIAQRENTTVHMVRSILKCAY